MISISCSIPPYGITYHTILLVCMQGRSSVKLAQLLDVVLQFGIVKIEQKEAPMLAKVIRLDHIVVQHLRILRALDGQYVVLHGFEAGRLPSSNLQTVFVGNFDQR